MSNVRPSARPSRHRLVYGNELSPFLTSEGPNIVGYRALVLLADGDGCVEGMVICAITRRTNSAESSVLLLLDGEIDGEPITSVAYTKGDAFPITSAGRRCIIHIDNREGDHVEDMRKIWQGRLSARAKESGLISPDADNSASP